jgi:hypothetical protein
VNADLVQRLEQLETKLRTQPQGVAGPGRSTGQQPGARFAAVYPAFQDRFRGSEAEITGRLAPTCPMSIGWSAPAAWWTSGPDGASGSPCWVSME